MSRAQYECPDCSGVVIHLCHPPRTYRRQPLSRIFTLPPLRTGREERHEIERQKWRDESPIFGALEDELGDRALLDGDPS